MKSNTYLALGNAIAASLLLSACSDNQEQQIDTKTQAVSDVRQLINSNQIIPFSSQNLSHIPSIDSPIAQLGKQLFFAKSLSGNMDTACASCHHPVLGGGDDLSLSIGVDAVNPSLLGPGRVHASDAMHFDGGPTVPRNAPTTFNIALYNEVMFHDGRVESLAEQHAPNGQNTPIRTPDSPFNSADLQSGANLAAAQARFPVTSKEEMRGFDFAVGETNAVLRDMLASRLRGETGELGDFDWYQAFANAMNSPAGTPAEELVTFNNIAFALGEYERSQIFINSPWNQFVAGDDNALSEEALRGAKLFFNTPENGGFNCASCHSGAFMTDEKFHVVALPQVGRGKGNGDFGDDDFGRYRETKLDDDKYAFRTPHLLNVTATGPWGHNGAYTSLTDIVKHHLNPAQMLESYNPDGIQPGIQASNWQYNAALALEQLTRLRSEGKAKLQDISYTSEQLDDLMTFLAALTDPCVEDANCLAPWIPTSADNIDGTLLNAEFATSHK